MKINKKRRGFLLGSVSWIEYTLTLCWNCYINFLTFFILLLPLTIVFPLIFLLLTHSFLFVLTWMKTVECTRKGWPIIFSWWWKYLTFFSSFTELMFHFLIKGHRKPAGTSVFLLLFSCVEVHPPLPFPS